MHRAVASFLRRKEGGREALNRWGFVAARIHRGGTGDNHVARSVAEFEIEPAAISREQAFPFLPLLHRSRILRPSRPPFVKRTTTKNRKAFDDRSLTPILLRTLCYYLDWFARLNRIEKWNVIDSFCVYLYFVESIFNDSSNERFLSLFQAFVQRHF